MYPERKLTWKEVTVDRVAGGTDLSNSMHYQAIQFRNTGTDWLHVFSVIILTGKPRAILAGQDKSIHTHISVSHDGDYAVAYAVIERL